MKQVRSIDRDKLGELVAAGKSSREIAPVFGVTRKVVIHAAKKYGFAWPNPKGSSRLCMQRAIPKDFALKASKITPREVARHYSAGWETVKRWYAESGVARFYHEVRPQRINLPRDLMTRHPGMSARRIAAETGINVAVIYARLRDGSVDRPASVVKPVMAANPSAAGQPKAVVQHVWRDESDAGQAVDFLRRFGPISKRGDTWLRGSTVMTGAELIALAERKGWKPWRIAA